MIKIIDNCCSPAYLDCLKDIAAQDGNWNMWNPNDVPIEDRFLKLNIIGAHVPQHPLLAGLAIGLLLQIHEAGGHDLFFPRIKFCGISIKDKHSLGKIHTDHDNAEGLVKILGIINSDWEETGGGGFFHDGINYYVKPTSFCIFDQSKPHMAEEIFTDKKRFAIDFTVFQDQQSFEKVIKIENK